MASDSRLRNKHFALFDFGAANRIEGVRNVFAVVFLILIHAEATVEPRDLVSEMRNH